NQPARPVRLTDTQAVNAYERTEGAHLTRRAGRRAPRHFSPCAGRFLVTVREPLGTWGGIPRPPSGMFAMTRLHPEFAPHRSSTRRSRPAAFTRHRRLCVEPLEPRVAPAAGDLDPTFGTGGLTQFSFAADGYD